MNLIRPFALFIMVIFFMLPACSSNSGKPSTDPKSEESASRKVAAWKSFVDEFVKVPDPLDRAAAREAWDKRCEQLAKDYEGIPFDPATKRRETKEIIDYWKQQARGKITGQKYNQIDAAVQDMERDLMLSK